MEPYALDAKYILSVELDHFTNFPTLLLSDGRKLKAMVTLTFYLSTTYSTALLPEFLTYKQISFKFFIIID